MSKATASSAVERCRSAALDTVWSQWQVLGGRVGGRARTPRAIVDPEALLLFSCALREDEPRLWDLVGGLLEQAPSLLSVQRTKNLAARYPQHARDALAEAAAIAVARGSDARWRPLAGCVRPRPHRAGKVHQPAARLGHPAALMLRLRVAFGVHVRSDALAFLLASAPVAATARETAAATGYGPAPVRRALEAMTAARIIVGDGARPARHHADVGRWSPFLGNAGLPPWRHWHAVFAFLAAALPPASAPKVAEQSPYLRSSDLRHLVLEHRAALALNRVAIPEPADFPGEAFLEGFESTLDALAKWLAESV